MPTGESDQVCFSKKKAFNKQAPFDELEMASTIDGVCAGVTEYKIDNHYPSKNTSIYLHLKCHGVKGEKRKKIYSKDECKYGFYHAMQNCESFALSYELPKSPHYYTFQD